MTIFQKMILVPILSILMYACFITYSYFEHQKSSVKIQQLRHDYLPVIERVNNTINLFENIQGNFKIAVLAQEARWLEDTITIQKKINENFHQLANHQSIVDHSKLTAIQLSFNQYDQTASKLAHTLLTQSGQWAENEALLQSIEQYQHETQQQLSQLKQSVQYRFEQTIVQTQKLQSQLLFWGMVISFISMVLLILVNITISYSTRSDMLDIVIKTKELAQGSTDFSQRIERNNRDELGYLVHWFNKLSDKLEADYLALKVVSITDKLTQLNNRNRTDQYLPSALQESQAQQSSMMVVIVDIDHFKKVNDNFGHLTGDNVLQHFAQTLKNCADEHDYISRWGGEEFLLVWKNIDPISAIAKANNIRQAIAALAIEEVGSITASFGVAVVNATDTMQSLIARADDNLYQAKESGRNKVVIDKEINYF